MGARQDGGSVNSSTFRHNAGGGGEGAGRDAPSLHFTSQSVSTRSWSYLRHPVARNFIHLIVSICTFGKEFSHHALLVCKACACSRGLTPSSGLARRPVSPAHLPSRSSPPRPCGPPGHQATTAVIQASSELWMHDRAGLGSASRLAARWLGALQ